MKVSVVGEFWTGIKYHFEIQRLMWALNEIELFSWTCPVLSWMWDREGEVEEEKKEKEKEKEKEEEKLVRTPAFARSLSRVQGP